MIKRFLPMLIAVLLVFSIVTLASARAPNKTDVVQAATVDTPVMTAVPQMTGFDVIQNISTEPRALISAQNTFDVDISTQMRLSSTCDLCKPLVRLNASTANQPEIVRRD